VHSGGDWERPFQEGISSRIQHIEAVVKELRMKVHCSMFLPIILAALSSHLSAQSLADAMVPPVAGVVTVSAPGISESYGPEYMPPTRATKSNNYLQEAFGLYPLGTSAVTAGWEQINNSPPEWRGGIGGYSRRFGSAFGMSAVSITTRYALSAPLHQDTMYYRCSCTGVVARARHALFSAFTARSGDDGHTVFSIPELAAPYAGSFAAVYGWYPDRYGAKDAFRIGNYSLLMYMGGNLSLEFMPMGRHSLLARLHFNNAHGATDADAGR